MKKHFDFITLALLLFSGCQPQFPSIVANTPAFGSSSSPKVFTASSSHPHMELWQVVDPEVRFSRNRSVGWDGATNGLASADSAGNMSFTVPSSVVFGANQKVFFQWKADYKLRDGNDRVPADSGEQSVRLDCSDAAVDAALSADQTTVLARFGALTNGAAVLAAGFIPSHGAASINGQGLAFVKPGSALSTSGGANPANPTMGAPDLLFFAVGPGGSLTLVGWAYGFNLTTATPPTLGCIPFESWFIHEAGWHMANGGFVATPPSGGPTAIARRSLAFPPVVGGVVWHTRIWDVHVWRSTTGVPVIGINQPVGPSFVPSVAGGGLTLPAGSFYAPPLLAP